MVCNNLILRRTATCQGLQADTWAAIIRRPKGITVNELNLPPLFLASKSPRRQSILTSLGLAVKVISSPYNENASDVAGLTAEETAEKLARLKAEYAAKTLSEGIVIGADTVVAYDDIILGKPKNRKNAENMLKALSGRRHRVISGLALINAKTGKTTSCAETTHVYFRKLSQKDIDTYLDTDEPYDKAGAYGIQGFAALFAERIEGSYFNVVGFPVVAFRGLMLQQGHDIVDFIRLNKR